jgi:hypothetical protein
MCPPGCARAGPGPRPPVRACAGSRACAPTRVCACGLACACLRSGARVPELARSGARACARAQSDVEILTLRHLARSMLGASGFRRM